MFEYFEHTADVGIRVRAAEPSSLFADAARALMGLIVPDPQTMQVTSWTEVQLAASNTEDLLFDWLAELLFHFDARQMVFSQFAVQVKGETLTARVGGEKFDPQRHQGGREVKAITYHGLLVRQTPQGWEAEVIVDV